MTTSSIELDTAPFDVLVGADVVEVILEQAPTKVASRIHKSLDHYSKAAMLQGVDEEMGAIRLIAAEEELVVAIFEWLKLNSASLPAHGDFVRKHKNHYVKLAFSPILARMGFILGDMVRHGITFDGLEDVIHLHAKPVVHEGQVILRIEDGAGKVLLRPNPLNVAISKDGLSDDEVVDELFSDLKQMLRDQHGMTVRQFITARADFRNKILYAEDGGILQMGESLEHLLNNVFSETLRNLLWCVALLLTNEMTARSWGLISQFIRLYRKALVEANVIKASAND